MATIEKELSKKINLVLLDLGFDGNTIYEIRERILNIELREAGMMILPREIYHVHVKLAKSEMDSILSEYIKDEELKNKVLREIHNKYLRLLSLEHLTDYRDENE